MAVIYNPDLLPESADPQQSIRYCNVSIIHIEIKCRHEEVKFHDWISANNTFVIEDCSPEYTGYEYKVFKGVVVREADGTYNWWKSIKQGDNDE